MAFHNTAARYVYSLAREGVLPKGLASTHDTFKSPHIASVAQTILAAIWVGLFAFFLGTDDPNTQAYLGVYTLLAVLGTMLLLILQSIVSVAIIVYFRKNHSEESGVLSTVVAPVIAIISQIYLVYLLVMNLETFGGAGPFGGKIPLIALVILAIGFVWGFALKFPVADDLRKDRPHGVRRLRRVTRPATANKIEAGAGGAAFDKRSKEAANGNLHAHLNRRPVSDRNRRKQGHRQGHCRGVRPQRRQSPRCLAQPGRG